MWLWLAAVTGDDCDGRCCCHCCQIAVAVVNDHLGRKSEKELAADEEAEMAEAEAKQQQAKAELKEKWRNKDSDDDATGSILDAAFAR